MSDQGSRGKGIPSWQRGSQAGASDSTSEADQPKPVDTNTSQPEETVTSVAETDSSSSESQAALLEQASRFLSDERMQAEPLHSKIEFLQSKGLARDTIEKALDLTSTAPANRVEADASTQPQQDAPLPTASRPVEVQQKSDTPPIITYPEHLLHSQKPPPIITASRLLNTAYVASAFGAAMYGLSHYLVKPMTETLTHARHDFAEHTLGHIDELNEKLEGIVSKIPSPHSQSQQQPHGVEDAQESDDEDPTELFHRDYGTQTEASIEQQQRRSGTSTPSSSDSNVNMTDLQTHKLRSLRDLIRDITSETSEEVKGQDETSATVKVLNESLESMAYPSVSSFTSDRYGIYPDTAPKDKNGKEKEDEITKMKAEIRSVKGMLLSARHFPASAANAVNAPSGGARAAVFG